MPSTRSRAGSRSVGRRRRAGQTEREGRNAGPGGRSTTRAGSVRTAGLPPGSGSACRSPSRPSTSTHVRRVPSPRAERAPLRRRGDPFRHYTRGGYDGRMPGYTKDKQKIEARLRRIEGQVRGIQKMIEEDRDCIDVVTQVNATRAALQSVALQLLADHTEHCVAEAIRSGGGKAKVRELNDAVERLVRS